MTIAMPATTDFVRMCHLAWTGYVSRVPRGRVPGGCLRSGGRSPLPAGQPPGLGRRGCKPSSASAVSPVSGVSVIWTVVPPVSVIWTIGSPVSGVCVIWTVVPPISVIPRTVVPRIVITPISVVTIPVPIGGAGGKYRRYKNNNQDNQDGFSHCRTPLGLPPNRGVRCFSPLLLKRWGGGGLFNAGKFLVGAEGGGDSPDIRREHSLSDGSEDEQDEGGGRSSHMPPCRRGLDSSRAYIAWKLPTIKFGGVIAPIYPLTTAW